MNPVVPLPKVALPKVSLPKVALPKISLSKVALPQVSLSKVSLSKASLSSTLPHLSLPPIALPKIPLPPISLPKVALPEIHLPHLPVAAPATVAALAVVGATLVASPAQATTTTVVGQGTYENTSSAVTLNGTWSTVASSQDSGGSTSSLNTAGSAELSFNTSGIQWISRRNAYSGIADVYLDGVKKTSVDLYSSSTKTQQVVYEVSGLSETTHTIKVVRTGNKNASSTSAQIQLDAFVAPDVHAPDAPTGLKAAVSGSDIKVSWTANSESDIKAYKVYRRDGSSASRTLIGTTTSDVRTLTDAARQPGSAYTYDVTAVDTSDNVSGYSTASSVTMPVSAQPAGTYENDDAAVTLNGPWSVVTSTMDSAGSYSQLNAAGYAEISFKTSGIRWISRLNSYSGIADVYLDGVKKASVDLYSATTKYQQLAYEVKGLPETTHTLRIVRTDNLNPASSGKTITLDSFVVPDIYAPSAPASLVAAPKTGSVQLGWNASPESDVVGYRVYRTALTGSSSSSTTTGPATAVNSTPVPSVTYVDDGLQPGASYRYQVTAVDSFGNESPKSAVADATLTMKAMPAGTYENDDPAINLNGPWAKTASTGANTDSGGSFSTLSGNGYAEMSFATSGIRWLARTNSAAGLADVYIDGVKKATVDLYSATTKYAQNVYEVNGLSESGHTIRIVRTGNKNPSSAGRNIVLDALVAPDIYAPSAPTAVQAAAIRTGADVSWTKSPQSDVAGYRILRRAAGSSTDVLVGTTGPQTTSFADVGLPDRSSFSYTVVARDNSGNDSPASAADGFTTPAESIGGNLRYATCPAATVNVTNRATLLAALVSAKSGDVIRLAPGTYPGKYDITTVATPDKPLWVCGPRTAVFDYGNFSDGYNIKISNAANVVLAGVTVRNAQKGITVIGSNHITVADNRVENIGQEAIHLKFTTTDSTVVGNSIAGTGLQTTVYGEGVYVGTSEQNWCVYTNCIPDASNRNSIVLNDISNTTAENIEAKAGTEDGLIAKNTLDAGAMVASESDSNIGVMGNGWVIAKNTMANAPLDAIQVWEISTGYGKNNTTYANTNTTAIPGYTARMPFNELNDIVGCDNAAGGAALGMSNKTCQS
jgi:hypothetical protein